MEKIDTKISKYEPASLAKRVFAGIMDGAVMIFTFFLFAIFITTPIANAAFHRNEINNKLLTYQMASHLVIMEAQNEEGDTITIEVKDSNGNPRSYDNKLLCYSNNTSPSYYLKRIYYYYHNFQTNTEIEYPTDQSSDYLKDCFYSASYNEPIDGVLPKYYYSDNWFSKNILEIESEDCFFKIDTSKATYLESIVLKDESKKADAVEFLKEKAADALSDLSDSKYFDDLYNKRRRIDIFIYSVAFVFSYSIYFILFPMLFKDGATLGKKTMHIAVISYNGYMAKKSQIFFRELLLLIVMFGLGIVVGIGLTSLAIMALGVVVLFLLTLVSKVKRSPFDFAAYTIVVDSVQSVWFKDRASEERHERELEENMSKYRKYTPDDSKLIQKGTEILDEELKKEIEEQNKSK